MLSGSTEPLNASRRSCNRKSEDFRSRPFKTKVKLRTFEKLELLKRNAKVAFYEPLVGAAAHALAAVCDRVRYGTIPEVVAAEATVQQAAALAANLAVQVH